MKIVYCTDSLNHLGGIERVTSVKASALAAIAGNEVYVVTAEGERKSIFHLDERIKHIDLDVRYYSDDWKSSRWQLFKNTMQRRKEHQKKLKKVLAEIKPNIIVSTGTSDKFFLPSISPKNAVVIREIHFNTNYRHLHAHGRFDSFKAWLGDIIDYRIKSRAYDQIYLLTKEDARHWKNNKKVNVMPNPNSFVPRRTVSGDAKKVIAVGRYSPPKRFDNLLIIWEKICHRFPDWTLEIWGEGSERERLETLIASLGIQNNAFLRGFTSDIEEQLLSASIFALTSDYEGFGLVVLEAMACGLAPICFACPTGPEAIITDGENGILIPMNQLDLYAERLTFLMENEQVRMEIGRKAIRRSRDFAPEKIAEMWMKEFKRLLSGKVGVSS